MADPSHPDSDPTGIGPGRNTPALSGRIGLLGDVHAEDEALAATLALGRSLAIARWLCVGDIADGRGDLVRTVDLLARSAVVCVRGNHDRWALEGTMRSLPDVTPLSSETRKFLADLPATLSFRTPQGGLLLCHGIGTDDMGEIRPTTMGYGLECLEQLARLQAADTTTIMVGGHTHEWMDRHLDGLRVINPGTLRGREGRAPGFCVLDLDSGSVERFERGDDGQFGHVRTVDAPAR